MITIHKTLDYHVTYPLEQFGPLEALLFFDIETTGFSGDYSSLYLIGCTCYRNSSWQLVQWFADRADAEEEVLHAFFEFMAGYQCLIHFNGDGFDIPYLLKRCKALGLSYDFDGIQSIDIYRLIRPYKKLLNLDSLKQKSIESFLGIVREDKYSGGQLIQVYEDYLLSHDQFLYELLILHNEDDLKGMPAILPILAYHDFLSGDFTYEASEIKEQCDLFGTPEQILCLTYSGCCAVPVPFQAETDLCTIEAGQERLTLCVPLLTGELKRFYADYQNYYYLTFEDTAIHKSVGQYVEKSAKKKATAKTCYTKVTGTFLPQPAGLFETVLKADYKDRQSYVIYEDDLFREPATAILYLKETLKKLTGR